MNTFFCFLKFDMFFPLCIQMLDHPCVALNNQLLYPTNQSVIYRENTEFEQTNILCYACNNV